MRVFIGMSNKTLYLRIGNFFRQIRKRLRRVITILRRQFFPMNCFAVQTGRGTGF